MKKYEIIAQWVRDEIASGNIHPGDKIPSESELTKRFGVSRNAVRQALELLSGEGVTETLKGIGTFCRSKSIDSDNSMNIAFVCFFSDSYIFPKMIKGCSQILYKEGYQLLLNQSEYNLEKEREILMNLKNKSVDGIIIEPVYSGAGESNKDLMMEINEQGIPIILLDNEFPEHEFSSIRMDDFNGGLQAAEYLWQCGHRDIGVFYQQDYLTKIRRKEGALEYLRQKGVSPENVMQIGFTGQGEQSTAFQMAEKIFQARNVPTAFICSSDEDALQLINFAETQNYNTPDDISIISFDNSETAQLNQVSLTSFEHPSAYIGHLAAKLLLEQIQNREIGIRTNTVIAPRLLMRRSVKKLHKPTEQ